MVRQSLVCQICLSFLVQTSLQQLFKMDKLLCLLCRKNYKEPKMCSRCSEIYCQNCIEIYLSKHHCCPSCNQILPELADCTRLIAQLKQHVKTTAVRMFKDCKIHKLPLKYQCVDCAMAICSDCGVIEQKHRGHVLQPRGNVYQEIPRGKLREYLVTVQQCILNDRTRLQQLNLQQQVLRSQLRWCKNRLLEYYQEMGRKLEDEAERLGQEIRQDVRTKQRRIAKLKRLKDDIAEILELRELNDEEVSNKVSADNQILQDIELNGQEEMFARLEQTIQQYRERGLFDFNRKSLTTLNEVYPQYINHTYEFDYQTNEFLQLRYSQPFHTYGQQWRLKIYPKGNGQSPNHLSLFLELINAPKPTLGSNSHPQQYYFRLELISLNTAGKTISKQYRSPFTTGDCWGYNDFVKLQELEEYLNNGHLIFVVGIKNCSYFDICENMRRYIRKLEGQKKVLQQLLSNSNLDTSSLIGDLHSNEVESLSVSGLLSESSNIVLDSDFNH